jgi:Domain of unknown function (DUF4276)
MTGIVFVEEQSAGHFIEAIARRLGIDGQLKIIAHEGKQDLERSFARKIPVWRYPPDVRFIVARDNDGANCANLKARLLSMVPMQFRQRVRVRLVMQELESWYLGDLISVAAAGFIDRNKAVKLNRGRTYRDPDRINNAAEQFEKIVGKRGKIDAAKRIGPLLNIAENRSASLGHFIDALRWAAEQR